MNVKDYLKEDGHVYVTLVNKSGQSKEFRVCDLVWSSFKGNIPNGFKVSHIDGNKENNSLDNLQLVKYND